MIEVIVLSFGAGVIGGIIADQLLILWRKRQERKRKHQIEEKEKPTKCQNRCLDGQCRGK